MRTIPETLPSSDFLREFPDQQSLAQQLADDVALWLAEGINRRGKASLVVSGGSTPKPFFEVLRKKDLPWEKVYVTLADERWVPAGSPDSTEKLVREHLLNDRMQFVPLYNGAASAREAEAAIEQRLAAMPRPFDAVILGMGEDGHTASLFPGHPALEEGLTTKKLCLAVEDSPKPPPERMTLSAHALESGKRVVIHITGEEKRGLLSRIIESQAASALPIARFINVKKGSFFIFWSA